jgi:5-methyltetrahydropteroyltriglutamate--homocysteine methyltransferase
MTLQQNTDRIQTTHIGSLPRPHHLLDQLKAKFSGRPFDEKAFEAALRSAIADVVRRASSPTSRSGSRVSSRGRTRNF